MSKSNDQILLLPGESGWEVWTRPAQGPAVLTLATEHARVGELDGLPGGELTLLFAVKSLTAVPLRVMSNDDALFPDLATLHAERLGLRPDPMAGQLMDVFVAGRDAESATLLALFLRPPAEGELPVRGPRAFDVSARTYPVEGDALVLWKELGRWVFAVHRNGTLIYCQATAVDSAAPNEALAREIKLSLMQLSMQELDLDASRIEVWHSDPAVDTSALAAAFDLPVIVGPRPAPVLPQPMSKLLPEDVRAARHHARRKRSLVLGIAAVVAVYLGLVGWLGFGLWSGASRADEMQQQAREAAPEGAAYASHMAKWNELADAIAIERSPVEILYRVAGCIPSSGGLRLENADISAASVLLRGEAPQLQAVNRFSLNLTKDPGLARFEWETPEPSQTTRGWKFNYRGAVPATGP